MHGSMGIPLWVGFKWLEMHFATEFSSTANDICNSDVIVGIEDAEEAWYRS